MISLTVLTDRTLSCILSLGYDRDVPGEDDRAMACYRELLDRLALQGYYSYRLSVGAMSSMGEPGTYHKVLESLKRTLDPNGILSPGRYVPAEKPAALSAAATSSRA
jgi:4-cresol dehydrogenase (hydroxylating)